MIMDNNFYIDILDNIEDGVYIIDINSRIIYWNKGAEKLTGYASNEAIGKICGEEMLMCSTDVGTRPCEELCPMHDTIEDRKTRVAEVYISHRQGFRVPVTVHTIPIRDSQRRFIGILKDNSAKLEALQKIKELEELSLIDPLTKVANRRYIEITLRTQLSEFNRYGWPFGILCIDIDYFKKINDAYGHETGDEVLKMVVNTLLNSLRSFDLLGRWGGEEFVAIVVNIKEGQLYPIADRLRMLVEQSSFTKGLDKIHVTISIGATLVQPGDTIKSLFRRADMLMYQSKDSGRNRVSIK